MAARVRGMTHHEPGAWHLWNGWDKSVRGERGHRSLKAWRPHFSETTFVTPSSGTSVQSLPGLYSFMAAAIREVFSPKFC